MSGSPARLWNPQSWQTRSRKTARPVRWRQLLLGQGKEDLVLGLQVQPIGLDEALDQAGQGAAMIRVGPLPRFEHLGHATSQAAEVLVDLVTLNGQG